MISTLEFNFTNKYAFSRNVHSRGYLKKVNVDGWNIKKYFFNYTNVTKCTFENSSNFDVCGFEVDELTKNSLRTIKNSFGNELYSECNNFLKMPTKCCVQAKSDLFLTPENCFANSVLELIFRDRLFSDEKIQLISYSKKTSKLFLSAFLKETGKSEGSSDLTGDGGILARKMVEGYLSKDMIEVIVDIGAQDADFVESFKNIDEKIIIDMNIATPFLSKPSQVKYGIGSAETLLLEPTFISDQERKTTLFAMNSFLNVLDPKRGCEIVSLVSNPK